MREYFCPRCNIQIFPQIGAFPVSQTRFEEISSSWAWSLREPVFEVLDCLLLHLYCHMHPFGCPVKGCIETHPDPILLATHLISSLHSKNTQVKYLPGAPHAPGKYHPSKCTQPAVG